MSELKRTQLYDAHVAAGADMVDFGGWEMPIQYPTGIVAEHLYTRHACGLFDVSHMGRLLIEGPERIAFLQHVLSSNVMALDIKQAQYAIIPDENGSAIDDAYLYKFNEENFLLVVNAANTEKDLAHHNRHIRGLRRDSRSGPKEQGNNAYPHKGQGCNRAHEERAEYNRA